MGAAMRVEEDRRRSLVDLLTDDPSAEAIAAWLGETRSPAPDTSG